MTQQEREKIYEGLKKHRGSLFLLAREQKITYEWIRQVLTGKAYDADILAAAANLWMRLERADAEQRKAALEFVSQAETFQSLYANS